MIRVRVASIVLIAAAFCVTASSSSVLSQEASLKPGINKSYENPDVEKRVEHFEGKNREISRKRNEIVEACQVEAGMDVADVGAGTGLFTRMIAKEVGPKGTVYAVDISDKFVEHILKTSQEQKLENVKGIVCSDDSTNLAPNSIDLAFICDTYHHFEFPYKTMATVHKALRPGGRLVVIDFKKIPGVSPDWIMGHVRCTQKEATVEMEEAGFELIDTVDIMEDQYVLRFKKK